MKHLTAIGKTVLSSLIISFTLLCAFPVLVFFAIARANNPKAIEQFIAILTSQANRQKKPPKNSNSYF
ncbi:MAG: hypothetical protein PVH61_01670 [Candidatus Aminicenantes bacterium]